MWDDLTYDYVSSASGRAGCVNATRPSAARQSASRRSTQPHVTTGTGITFPPVLAVSPAIRAPIGIQNAREKGYAAYIDDGANRWPACHRDDAARVFRLAIEKGGVGRSYHAVAEEGLVMRDLMSVIAQGLGVPPRSITRQEAKDYHGWFTMFAQMDNPTANLITRSELGWEPIGPTTFEDMRQEDYFGVQECSR